MSFADRMLVCRECGQEFTFTAGEQEFFAQKGFTNEPNRCMECRAARKQRMGGEGMSSYDTGGGYGGGSYGGGGGGYGGGRDRNRGGYGGDRGGYGGGGGGGGRSGGGGGYGGGRGGGRRY